MALVSASLCNDSVLAFAPSGLEGATFDSNFPSFTFFTKKCYEDRVQFNTEVDLRFCRPKLGIYSECEKRNSSAQPYPKYYRFDIG